jgi:outer membrane immunogenic protein
VRGFYFCSAVVVAVIVAAFPAAAQSPNFDWAGPYIGGHLGGSLPNFSATGHAAADSLVAGPLTVTKSFGGDPAGLAGVYAGFNFQNEQGLVVGGEADFNWTRLSATSPDLLELYSGVDGSCTISSSYICLGPVNSTVHWYGTARATVGHAINQLLLYGTAGIAYGEIESSVSGTWRIATQVPPNQFFDVSTSSVRLGWTAGLGAAIAIHDNVALRLEWNHVDLGERTIGEGAGSVSPCGGCEDVHYEASVKDRIAFDTLRIGLTILFQ